MSSRSTSERGATRKTIARATCWRSARRPGRCSWSTARLPTSIAICRRGDGGEPLFDFEARRRRAAHVVAGRRRRDRDALVAAFAADAGAVHRRWPSSRRQRRTGAARDSRCGDRPSSLGDDADSTTFLAVAFPHDQVADSALQPDRQGSRRAVAPTEFLDAVRRGDSTSADRSGPPGARRDRDVSRRRWHTLRRARRPTPRSRSGRSTSACCRMQLLDAGSRASPTSAPTSASISSVALAAPASSRRLVDSGHGCRGVLAVSRSASTT